MKGEDLLSDSLVTEGVKKLADLSLVKHEKQYQGLNGQRDEELSSVVVNGSGVCDVITS